MQQPPIAHERTITPNHTAVILSNSVMVFLRTRIGHRAAEPRTLIVPFLLHGGIGFVNYFINKNLPAFAHNASLAQMIYAYMMMLLSGYHTKKGWKLAMQNPPLHTMSQGYSILSPLFKPFRITQAALQIVIEPLLLLALAYYFFTLKWYLLSYWIGAAAPCLLYVETIATLNMRTALLDLRDSRAEGEALLRVEDHATTAQTPTSQQKAKGQDTVTLSPELELPKEAPSKKRGGWGRR
jgi:hypothetical protein